VDTIEGLRAKAGPNQCKELSDIGRCTLDGERKEERRMTINNVTEKSGLSVAHCA
jgi:hypothetical protein